MSVFILERSRLESDRASVGVMKRSWVKIGISRIEGVSGNGE